MWVEEEVCLVLGSLRRISIRRRAHGHWPTQLAPQSAEVELDSVQFSPLQASPSGSGVRNVPKEIILTGL